MTPILLYAALMTFLSDAAVLSNPRTALAVWKSKNGRLREVSASCTYAGCIVTWNNDLTSDCPFLDRRTGHSRAGYEASSSQTIAKQNLANSAQANVCVKSATEIIKEARVEMLKLRCLFFLPAIRMDFESCEG